MKGLTTYNLDNGLKVFLKEDIYSPVSSIFVWINTGSAYEDDSQRGLAHVHEHMIFKGTENLMVGEISKKLEAHGGEVNAFTSFDETVYYTTISNEFIDIGLNILSDCMVNATFDERELSKELEVILEEIKRGNDSPSNCLSEMIFNSTFSSSNYGLPIIGTPNSVKSFKRSDVKNFYDKWYQAENMHLVVVGGGNTNEVKSKINETFGKIRAKKVEQPKFSEKDKLQKLTINIEKKEVNEVYFSLSFKSVSANRKETAIFDIISHILGSGSSSLLYKELKEDLSLVTSIYSSNYSMRHSGVFMVSGTMLHENIDKAIKGIIERIKNIQSLNFDYGQVERAKNSIISDDLHENETVQGQAQSIGYLHSLTGNIDSKDKYLNRIKDVTLDEISSVANDFLKVENLNLNFIFPKDLKINKESHFSELLNNCFTVTKNLIKKESKSYIDKDYSMSKITHKEPCFVKLENGIDLLVLQNTKTPLFSLRTVSMGGLRYEDKSSNGKFSLLAELLERGSENLTKEELSMKIELLGADIEGYSGKNTVGLKLLGPSANLRELTEIFSEVLCSPLFLENEIEIVKQDILSYLNRKKQNYAALAADKFYEMLFPNHPYSMNQYGTDKSLKDIVREDISSAYKESIINSNLLVSAVGNFDFDKLIEHLNGNLDINFSDKMKKADSNFSPISDDLFFESKLGDKQQSHIIIGTYAPPMESDEQYAFHVMNSCLSGMGGRLFLELRDKKSLAYTVSSFYGPSPYLGHFGIYIGCSPEKKEESIAAINNEINSLVSQGVTSLEIERSKNYLIGRNDISLQRNANINSRISQSHFFGLGPKEPFHFSSKIRNVTIDQVNEVIEKYLNNTKKVTVAFEPL
tara:strand:+ start:32845 stop:35439 length:2595 start_codon:yes stop_codon:yes gene_type:complete